MCRLYGFRATEPTKIECTLVHAQNALIVQSYRDHSGTSHLNGWGLALYQDGRLQAVRQAKAAVDDSDFRRAAGRAYSDTVLAHVRRATIGRVALENTHPFRHGRWAFVHNGTLPRFDKLQMLAMMTRSTAQRSRAKPTASIFFMCFSRLMIRLRLGHCAKYSTRSWGRSPRGTAKSIPPPGSG